MSKIIEKPKEHESDEGTITCKRKKKKYKPYEEISGEFKKIKPPVFNGEIENGEESKAWLSRMKKYFQIYNYSDRLKTRMAIYNLTGKAHIWWKDVKRVMNIKEIFITWTTFKKYIKRKFMSEQYFEEKEKELYDLKLGSMTMKELCSKFLSLLRFVPYKIDEKPKIQRFLSCLPLAFKDKIEYDNPKILEEAMRKASFCYEQSKNRRDNAPN